jgi:hypothetical protein
VNSKTRIVSVGFVWGWLQASVLFLAILFFAGQSRRLLDFGLSWEIGLLSAVLTSFFAGTILSDIESTFKALLLSVFVAFGYSMLIVSVIAVPISVSPQQGYAEAIFFGFLAPVQFFVGIVAGITGAVFGGWFIPRIRRLPT